MRIAMLSLSAAAGLVGCGGCPDGTVPAGDGCVMVVADAPIVRDTPIDAPRDAPSDAADVCVSTGLDEIDAEGLDSNCDGVDGVDADQVYVSPAGDDGNTGTRSSPLRTIARALRLAMGRPVLVATGTYSEDIDRSAGGASVVIHGGYDPTTWARTTMRSVVSTSAAGVILRDIPGGTLSQLEIAGRDAGDPGQSAYGLRVTGTGELTLSRCLVTVGRGAAGLAGTNGSAGLPGVAGRAGLACVTSGSMCTAAAPMTPAGTPGAGGRSPAVC